MVAQLRALSAVKFYPSLMYALKEAIAMYFRIPACSGVMLECAEAFSMQAARVFSSSPTALIDNPDFIIDYFGLMRACVRYLPIEFVASPMLAQATAVGLAALPLEHREAVSGVRRFWNVSEVLAIIVPGFVSVTTACAKRTGATASNRRELAGVTRAWLPVLPAHEHTLLWYRGVPKFWTHGKIFYVFCDLSVRGAKAT